MCISCYAIDAQCRELHAWERMSDPVLEASADAFRMQAIKALLLV